MHDASDPGQGGIAGIRSTHHPFTAPEAEDLKYLDSDPLSVKAQHYDLVVNGVELGGGSVRIHDADLQYHILKEIIQVPTLIAFDNRSCRTIEYESFIICWKRWPVVVLPMRE